MFANGRQLHRTKEITKDWAAYYWATKTAEVSRLPAAFSKAFGNLATLDGTKVTYVEKYMSEN